MVRYTFIISLTAVVPGMAACVNIHLDEDSPLVAGSSGTSTPTTDMVPTTAGLVASTGETTASTDEVTTEDASSGEGTAGPSCGNGIVEEGEFCDLGFEANGDDDQLCTEDCQAVSCGDGHVQPANAENCDDGPENVAEPGYGECSTSCERGPHCGDGVLQPEQGEDCETGLGESDNCTPTCVYQPRYMFLTSAGTSGDLNGIAGADAWCNELVADSPTLTGTFRAWLLVDGQSLADRFPEFSGVSQSWNFMTVNGDLLAKKFAALIAEGPDHPILYTEAGDVLPEWYVWTNITSAGQAAGGDCGQWTDEEGLASLVGYSGFDPDEGPDSAQWHAQRWWTDLDGTKLTCNNTYPHIYCIQVAD